MLIRFSVENYLSFRDRVELSMIPGPVEKHAHHVVQPPTPNGMALLKTAIIYGANASGKSNLVKAIADAQRMIMLPVAAGSRLPTTTFKLDPEAVKKPSRFEFEIKIGEAPGGLFCEPWNVYVALEFNNDNVLSEIHIREVGTCL